VHLQNWYVWSSLELATQTEKKIGKNFQVSGKGIMIKIEDDNIIQIFDQSDVPS